MNTDKGYTKREYKEYLDECGLSELNLPQGVYTTCKVAFEYGYRVIIPEETNTTFDNEYLTGKKMYELYNHKVWNKRFADVISVAEVIRVLQETNNF